MVVMTASISAAEQLMLEMVNRARLDPGAEASRLGVALTAGLQPGSITTAAKQVLVHNSMLENAAVGHAQWMLAADVFSHTGFGGSTPGQRATAAGYDWNTVGENISWQGSTAAISANLMISTQHDALFKSAGHRANLMKENFTEIGIAQELGRFQSGANIFNASMVAQSFGRSGSDVFITGVAYDDNNLDRFYTIGEGKAGLTMIASDIALLPANAEIVESTVIPTVFGATESATAGGYALKLAVPMASVHVTGSVGTTELFTATIGTDSGNVKLDVVSGKTLYTSGDITLLTGINNLRLLGVAALDATGNAADNTIVGNKGANILVGNEGVDKIGGDGGNDFVFGGAGNDFVYGGTGNDKVYGGADNDYLSGGAGADQLFGGAGSDRMLGGTGIDSFVFENGTGRDSIADFDRVSREKLIFDDQLWGNAALTKTQVVAQHASVIAGSVVFNFGDGDVVTLTGIRTLSGLSALIEII